MMVQRLKEQSEQGGSRFNQANMLSEALEMLIYERSQLLWAKEQNIRIGDDELNSLAESMAMRNELSLDQLFSAIERRGVSKKRFLQNLREQQILQRLRDREVPGRIKITEPEIDRVLVEQKASVAQQAQIELAQILIALPESASPEQVAEAEQKARLWRTQIEQGTDFETLARQHSQSDDRSRGGHMGLRPSQRYPELFISAVQNLPPGTVTGPIRSGAGWHLLKVVSRQPGVLTLPQTKARHILLKIGGELTPGAALNKLNSYKAQIDRGQATFDELARLFSQDGSAPQGGDLGWASPGQFVPEFEQVMAELKPGQVSEPFISRFGAHLMQVTERREIPLTTSQEREYARNLLRESKYDEALDTWARDVRGRAYVEYREPPQ
jgi:peptidyl-prolyl cis-trans isomerase SurA